ncbi:B-cadherin isoform X2 [Narcine bancroftii]|uniref:B-cadherin isoform X2 n=1 Tax=Narcine bancroftii TaxID=1343680 RepID=UPI00383125E2
MRVLAFPSLAIVALLMQVEDGDGSQSCPGFDTNPYVFQVESLAPGQVLGRVHFNCSEQKGLKFSADDSCFQVESDGRVLVSRSVPGKNQIIFRIIASSRDDAWETTVKVLINGEKVNDSAEDGTAVPVIMWPSQFSSSALRRKKREWVIPSVNYPENERGPFPKYVVQIKSNRQEEMKVIYSITGPGADQPPINVFTIDRDDGKIVVHQPLDREQIASYNLLAHALDENQNEIEDAVDVLINVIDMNDNRPQFTSPTFYGTVVEGATPGTAVMNVTATDADDKEKSNAIIAYSLPEEELLAEPMFAISSKSGLISVLKAGLDREKQDKYTLQVQAADMEGVGLMTTATAIITITDTNDNVPKFVKPSITVEAPENEVDYIVSRHAITDDDLPQTPAWKANFSIIFGNEKQQFMVETDLDNNGVLKIIKPLDFEKDKQHKVIIEVKNQIPFTVTMSLSSATVTINVTDVNEAPIFTPETKMDKHPENRPVGSTLTSCKAIDPDTAQNQVIKYQIGSDPGHWFEIESDTGIVKLVNFMDRESEFVTNNIYTVTILAYDNGSPVATGTGTILLELEDINDNPPIATSFMNRVCNQDPLPVNVTITDKDIPPNTYPYAVVLVHRAANNWTVELTDRDDVKLLRLKREIDPGVYEVSMRVKDNGKPHMSQVTGLQVEVCDCANGVCKEKRAGAAFGISGILAILGAILALLILALLLLLFARKRRSVKKEPLLPEEDIRDNVYHYDEEGGGEEDQDYDLSQLHRGLDSRPDVVRNDVVPLLLAPQYRPRPANPDEIGNFIDENLKTADDDPTAPPYDSLLVFDYEGVGSEAESLSSLNSSNKSDADQDYDHLNNWGPRFRKLAEMYGNGEE